MIVRYFTKKEDWETGNVGWIPEFMPSEAVGVSTGVGIAHDVLEHLVDKIGGFEGEMMALGALLWGRGQAGTLNNRDGLKFDIAFSLENILYKNETLKDPGHTYRLNDDYDSYFEEMFERHVYEGIRMFRRETHEDGQIYDLTDSEVKRRIIGWLRKGVRAANDLFWNKYRADNYAVAMLFKDITNLAEKPAYDADNYYTGDRLKVSLDLGRCEVKMKVISSNF